MASRGSAPVVEGTSRSDATRTRMIDTAERLAAEQGLGALSLRAVQAAAGQRNKSAAQYHFGSRDGLITAVVTARMGPVNDRRHALLEALDARTGQGTEVGLRDLLETLVVPLADETIGRAGSSYARFLLQSMADPTLAEIVRTRFEGRSYVEVCERIDAYLVDLPAPLRRSRLGAAVGLMITTLAMWEGAPHPAAGAARELSTEARVADLVDLCLAVLTTPMSSTTRRLVDPD